MLMNRSRTLSIAAAAVLALVMIAASGLAAHAAPKTPCGGNLTKCVKAEITPHSVVSKPDGGGSTTSSFTLTIINESSGTTQLIDSCDYTPASPLVIASVTPTVAVYNSANVPQASGTSTLSGNTDQLRNMKIPYKGKAVAQLSMTYPDGSGSAGGTIACKLSNGFNNNDPSDPQSNAVANDAATNLNVSWAPPAPTPNFSVSYVDQ